MTNIDDRELVEGFRGNAPAPRTTYWFEGKIGKPLVFSIVLWIVLANFHANAGFEALGPAWDGKTNAVYGSGELLKKADFGEDWPYSASDEAFLRCIVVDFGANTSPRPVVTVEVNGAIYGVNGVAKGRLGLRDGWDLLARGDFDEPVYKASHDFIDRAISNCKDSRDVMSGE